MATTRVLVVEDQAIVARHLESNLQELGYVVVATALSGEETIQRAAETQPDLVLMDIRLPGEMNGIEAAYQIQARCPTPVVVLTAYASPDLLEQASAAGVGAYLIKPLTRQSLRARLPLPWPALKTLWRCAA